VSEEAKQPLFERLAAIDVSKHVEKKGQFTYLSWAHAWRIFKQECPDATYSISRFDDSFCHHEDALGYMCHTTVTAEGQTHEMWLPVMDFQNKAMNDKATMCEVNKTIMRCLVKNLAMFGLGLYIYAGEDLPESADATNKHGSEPQKPASKPAAKPDPRAVMAKRIEADKDAKWFEVVAWEKGPHKGLTLGDVAANGDAEPIKAILHYIDPVALEHETAVKRLKDAITEAESSASEKAKGDTDAPF